MEDAKQPRPWRERLKFLGAISGFLALLASAVTFSISTGVDIYKELTWRERAWKSSSSNPWKAICS